MSRALSFIFRQGLEFRNDSSNLVKLRAKGFRVLRRLILRVADPPCEMNIWGRSMRMPLSHELPGCLARDRHYDQILKRVCNFIRATQGAVCGIDVGANIGDTIAASMKDKNDEFLGIEPNPLFFQYLTRNLAGFPNVQLLNVICSTTDGIATYRISTTRGTASFEKSSSDGQSVQTNRLDTIVAQFSDFGRCNFLKIDTDGHDFEVLRGARNLITAAKPAILFECEMRQNANYITEAVETVKFFEEAGYDLALVYDQCGEMFGVLNLNDAASLLRMLFYQVTGGRCNFDVLVMQAAGDFLKQELKFFANETAGKESQTAAQTAAKLIAAEINK